MNLEFITEYTVPIIVGICLCSGYVVKHAVPTDKINRFIPLLMAVLGVGLNIWLNGHFTAPILLGGLFSGLASTGLHQAFTKLIDKNRGELK